MCLFKLNSMKFNAELSHLLYTFRDIPTVSTDKCFASVGKLKIHLNRFVQTIKYFKISNLKFPHSFEGRLRTC